MWSGTKSAIGRAALSMVGSASYVHENAERQHAVAALSRPAAKGLAGSGLSGADIAVVFDVSPQRVSQLLRS